MDRLDLMDPTDPMDPSDPSDPIYFAASGSLPLESTTRRAR